MLLRIALALPKKRDGKVSLILVNNAEIRQSEHDNYFW